MQTKKDMAGLSCTITYKTIVVEKANELSPAVDCGCAYGTMEEDEKDEILRLHQEIMTLQHQIEVNEKNGKESLDKVHEYNDIKDIGQMLLGRLGQLENKTIQELYGEYNIDMND